MILELCDGIRGDIGYFGEDEDDSLSNKRYQHSVAMSVMQIGERVKTLRKEFKERYDVKYRKMIAGMRDVVIHAYTIDFDLNRLWKWRLLSSQSCRTSARNVWQSSMRSWGRIRIHQVRTDSSSIWCLSLSNTQTVHQVWITPLASGETKLNAVGNGWNAVSMVIDPMVTDSVLIMMKHSDGHAPKGPVNSKILRIPSKC